MTQQDILKSLPLLASVLGRQYGVQVTIGGAEAYTNGRIVNLPALPLDADSEVLSLLRGFVDHEAGGHLRFTDFSVLQAEYLYPVEKFAWNAIEDWRVERALSDIYPGCKANLEWLARRIFVEEFQPSQDPATALMSYVLLTCRAWSVPEIEASRQIERQTVAQHYPQLLGKLDALLAQVRDNCPDTRAALDFAKEISELIEEHQEQTPDSKNAEGQEQGQAPEERESEDKSQGQSQPQSRAQEQEQEESDQDGSDSDTPTPNQTEPIRITEENLPKTFSEQLADRLGTVSALTPEEQQIHLAIPVRATPAPLPEEEQRKALSETTGLRYRLQGMLQATRMRDTAPSRHGRLCPHNLHRMFVGNPRLFRSDAPTPAVNTAVHLLVDTSGSMSGQPIRRARQACFAIAHALKAIPGINMGVTTFPAHGETYSVSPVLEHGKPFHSNFLFETTGSTPLTEALLWATQELCRQPEPRKILIVLTDGSPDNPVTCRQAIAEASRFVEILGIGIWDESIKKLLPDSSAIIYYLSDLSSALFNMLQNTLISRR